jgi:hypothetical protein
MKYPGQIPDKQMEDWFSNAASKAGYVPLVNGKGKINPCLALYGKGPEGKRCKECKLLFRHLRFFKCELRGFTHGPATDHRANWPACGKFEPEQS